jgi:peptide/nickel transport system permease protein
MAAYIVRRLLLGIIVLFLVTIIVFLLMQLVPGDPVRSMLGLGASQEQVEALRHELWLDRPVIVQYTHWLSGVVQGDLGYSIKYRENVTSLITIYLPTTIHLAFVAFVLSTILGIGAGIVCAIRRGGILDSLITFFSNIGIAVPVFWLGILGIYYFGLKLGWVPIGGYTSPFTDFWHSARQTILPIICIAVPAIAILSRQTRSSMLEVIRQDYIRTATSKGLKERVVVTKHALKNALIPVITLLGVELSTLFAGSVLVESVFNIPGMGSLLVQAALSKDFVVVQACTLMFALIVILVNLLVDIAYGWLNPAISYD